MTAPCPDMQNRILNLAMSHSSTDERKSIEIHMSSCEHCRKYYENIIPQLQRLESFGQYVQSDMEDGCRNTIESLNMLPDSTRPRYKKPLNKLVPLKAIYISAAAVVITAACLLAINYLPGILKPTPSKVVKQDNNPQNNTEPEKPAPDNPDQDQMLEQFKKANIFYNNSNSDELIWLLKSKHAPIRMIVAKFLSEVGDEKAIPPLRALSDQWQGSDQENNPFLQAIDDIASRYRETEIPATDEIVTEIEIITETAVTEKLEDTATETVKPEDARQQITFTGQVIDTEGQPVMASLVTIKGYQMDDPEKWISGITDQHGNFTVSAPETLKEMKFPIAIWAVIPDNPDFIAWTLIKPLPNLVKDLPHKLPGNPGTTEDKDSCKTGATGIQLTMEPAGIISGIVTDPLNNPVPQTVVTINFSIAAKSGSQMIPSAHTWPVTVIADDQGYYLAGNLPMLWAECLFEADFSTQAFVSKKSKFKAAGPLNQHEMNIMLIPVGPTVTGVLTDNYGIPLAGRKVIAFVNRQDADYSVESETGNDGNFSLVNCPPDPDLTVMAKLSDDTSVFGQGNGVFYPDVIIPVEFTPDNFEYTIDLTAVKPELIFEVLVVDTQDNPLPDFAVQLKDTGGVISALWQKQFLKSTDETGTCIFDAVPELEGIEIILDTRASKNSAFSRYKSTTLSVNLNPGQNEYFLRAILYTEEELSPEEAETF